MHDFDKLVYLDLQKTGSTFVSAFLKHSCLCKELKFEKHAWVGDDYRDDAAYVISVRHPLMMYSSLYRYGLERKGELFFRLQQAGRLDAYASLDAFAHHLLRPPTPQLLSPHYAPDVAAQLGFMSFRYLLLNLRNPLARIRRALDLGESLAALMSQSIVQHVIRSETLNDDLFRLGTEILPQCFNLGRVVQFLDRAPRINSSSRKPQSATLKSRELATLLEDRESLLMTHYRPAA